MNDEIIKGKLPAPRLQLRWMPSTLKPGYEWECHYELHMNTSTAPTEPTDEQIRERFERSVSNSPQLKGNTPLGTVTINGAFSHYAHPDTDTLWLGYRAGFRAALRA